MKLQARVNGTVCIVDISGRLAIGEGDLDLRQRIAELVDSGERRFLLNLRDVPYLDSVGVAEIVAAAKRVREQGGEIKLLLSPRVNEVFMITRLHLAFDIHEDEAGALASFARS